MVRALLVALAALAFAAPASAFSEEEGMQTMDDGVPISFTRYTPDGAVPTGGRPGVLVGIVAGLAASIAARSPLVAGIRDDAPRARGWRR